MIDHFIYALRDPRTNVVRYVGVTTRPEQRKWEHYVSDGSSVRDQWITELKDAGFFPKFMLLEQATGTTWHHVERKWIAHFHAQGCHLTNSHGGTRRRVGSRRRARMYKQLAHVSVLNIVQQGGRSMALLPNGEIVELRGSPHTGDGYYYVYIGSARFNIPKAAPIYRQGRKPL